VIVCTKCEMWAGSALTRWATNSFPRPLCSVPFDRNTHHAVTRSWPAAVRTGTVATAFIPQHAIGRDPEPPGVPSAHARTGFLTHVLCAFLVSPGCPSCFSVTVTPLCSSFFTDIHSCSPDLSSFCASSLFSWQLCFTSALLARLPATQRTVGVIWRWHAVVTVRWGPLSDGRRVRLVLH
jgi:hypothetical protein